jgi:hypothetical protein
MALNSRRSTLRACAPLVRGSILGTLSSIRKQTGLRLTNEALQKVSTNDPQLDTGEVVSSILTGGTRILAPSLAKLSD